jgi:ferritin-like protein
MGSETLHEPFDSLTEKTRNLHRGVVSLIEELEAIDWYQQRAEACTDEALKRVLIHNRNEEIEHAAMTLEWIRRNDGAFDATLRAILFTDGAITELEEAQAQRGGAPANGSLAIGSLKQVR